MSYYRGGYDDYDDDDYGGYGGDPYASKNDSYSRDRYGGYGGREERDYRSGGRRESGYDGRRESGYDGRRESSYDRRSGYGGRDIDYEERDRGFGGRRDSGRGGRSGRDDRRPKGGRGRGSFSRENGGRGRGRGMKRSFGGRDGGSSPKKLNPGDNWGKTDRHLAMKSHFMETIPENFEEDWLCIICPAGKRRIVVAANNITQTYNSEKRPDQKFKSCLPNGSPLQMDVMKYDDLTILDTVYCTHKKQFYIIDMLHWKLFSYYETEAEFRAFFLPEKYNQLKTPTELSENNEYPLILLEKFPCSVSSIEQALKETDYKVEGLMFINKNSTYECSDSPNSLLLRLDQMEKLLGIPVREGISYTKTTSADAEWQEELKTRKKLKAVREAAKDSQDNEKEENENENEKRSEKRDTPKRDKDGGDTKDDTLGGTWGKAEYSAAYYD